MASMSSITAAMEGDQEVPATINAASGGGAGSSHHHNNSSHRYIPSPWDFYRYGMGYESDDDDDEEEENSPDFPSDPEKYNQLMINLALMVDAMRRMGVFEREDDSNCEDEDDEDTSTDGSVVPQQPEPGIEPVSMAQAVAVDQVNNNSDQSTQDNNDPIVKKKKTVRFQIDDNNDDDDVDNSQFEW